ncbi:MAG TPA: methyltransferase [Candidatus Babeliales bacterium]|nr:methyltransferase [Candidatus Babeliales bacterium]
MNRYFVFMIFFVAVSGVRGIEISHEWDAQRYQENSSFQYELAMSVLSEIFFAGNELVLDIGCRDGRITEKIAGKLLDGGFVEGIDVSLEMIRYACDNHQRTNLSFSVKDISEGTSFDSLLNEFKLLGKYDIALAFLSLSWIKNQSRALKNIATLLKPGGGRFVAIVSNENDAELRARYKMFTHEKWCKFFVDYEVPYYPCNEVALIELLRDAGFSNSTVKIIERPSILVTKEEFIGLMSAIPAQKDRIPQALQQEFFNDIVTEYLKEVPQKENGLIELIFSEILVIAHI